MVLRLKQSQIVNWWIAERNDQMNFFNILSGKSLSTDMVVTGYLNYSSNLVHSTNSVVRITKRGVITAKGTFYPFKDAHPLYLKFLLEVNRVNTISASHWKILDEASHKIVANIMTKEGMKENAVFDFDSYSDLNVEVMFSGYSTSLSSNVVLSTFSRKENYSLTTKETVASDIYASSFISNEEHTKLLERFQRLFLRKIGRSRISVTA